MTSAFTGWKFLVNFLLPPPMVLTFLLVLPFPRSVRKGLLIFTNHVLSFTVLGGLKFVHLALVLSGVPLIDSGFRTYKCANETANPELTPNQRISVLAKKWREERNFWIAAMTFTLWCLLTVLYSQVNHAMKVHDKLDEVQEELNELKGIPKPTPPTSRTAGVGHKLQAGAAGVTNSLQTGAAGVTSKLSGMGWGAKQARKAKVEPEATSSVKEAEMTAASPGVTTRRRMAAAPASD